MSTQIDLGPVLSVPKGDWNANTTYERLNLVRHNSASWICNVATSKGVEPTEDSTDWYLQVKDTSSVTSVNGMKGDVEITTAETPSADDSSTRIATTEWVTGKLGDVDLSGIKDDTIEAVLNASSLEVGTGELTSADIAKEFENKLSLSGGTMTGALEFAENVNIAIATSGTDGFGIHRKVNGELWDTNFFRLSPDGTVWIRAYENGKRKDFKFRASGDVEAGGIRINTPVGAVIAFAANKAPDGFLLCNGATVSRTTYSALFSAIGTTYGTGDGSSTFALPDLTDRFIQGSGTAGAVKNAALPNITGDFDAESGSGYDNTSGAFVIRSSGSGKAYNLGGSHLVINFSARRSSTVYSDGCTTVQPPALTMRYYIKY